MNVACAMLAGGNRESVIADAIASVIDIVDHLVLIDTGTAQKAIEVAQGILGDRCSVFAYPGQFDCATARNFALKCAVDSGFDWALMLDTDERLHAEPGIVRRMLSEVTDEIVLIEDDTRTYPKTKFFKSSHAGQWAGIVHEAYCSDAHRTLAKGITFSELPKTAAENAVRDAWVEAQTRKAMTLEPGQARWHYYRGDALQALGRWDEAIEEFLEAATLSAYVEEIDWSHYRAAVLCHERNRTDRAIQICIDSSLRIPELAWYAAFCLLETGRYGDAVQWANKALVLAERQRDVYRLGFSYKFAWYEGGWDVLRWAYRSLKEPELERKALAMVEKMIELRTSGMTRKAA